MSEETTRQKTIDYLYYLKTHLPKNLIIPEYIDFAISSLETDEAYNLMYEEPEFCEDCISRKEAIKAIRTAKVNFSVVSTIDFRNYKREVQEIINGVAAGQEEALKLLPSVLPNVHGNNVGNIEDCISKADALKLNVYAPIAPIVEGENVHWEEIILTEELRKLPSVLPKIDARRKGHWDKEGACPFCDYLRHWRDDNYCAHCGADLRKDG